MDLNKKLILCAAAVLAVLAWKMRFSSQSEAPQEVSTEGPRPTEKKDRAAVEFKSRPLSEDTSKKNSEFAQNQSGSREALPSSANFVEVLKDLGSCLEVKNATDSEYSKAQLDHLISSVKNEMGIPQARSQDWQNIHLTLPNGEQRRIHIETEDQDAGQLIKRLKYYGVDHENLPVELPLAKEIAVNPKDSDLALLETNGQVTLRENSGKIYFSKGEVLTFIEKNNFLSDLEMNRNGHVFKCTDLQRQKPSCSCL